MFDYMRDEVWTTINGIGELTIEELLVVADEPILFTCRLENSLYRYLVMTYDSDDYNFVISPIHPHILAQMLMNNMTLEEAFRESGTIYYTKRYNDSIICEEYASSDFSSELLPKKGEYYDLKLKYIDRYITKLINEPDVVFNYQICKRNTNRLLKEQYFYCNYFPKQVVGNPFDHSDLFLTYVESFISITTVNNLNDNILKAA